MAFEKIKYISTPVPHLHFVKLGFLWGSISFAFGWLLLGSIGWGILLAIGGITIGILLPGYKIIRERGKSFSEAKKHLANHGCQADFELVPLLAIDSKSRKIAFVNPHMGSYDLYDFSDILGWEHQWVNKANTVSSLWSARVTYLQDSKTKNVLVFQTKNPHQPLYKISLLAHSAGEIWMARLNAMMSR